MVIACLGWGSLVWNKGTLPVREPWFTDGPFLPIEFARQSNDGRITLVLVPDKPLIQSLWAKFSITDISAAREALREREEIPNIDRIGKWEKGDNVSENDIIRRIDEWAKRLNLDAVIWTNLRPKFNNRNGKIPTAEEIIAYLSKLEGKERKDAERYIRMAPRQTDTEYRRLIERELHWMPYEEAL